MTNPMNQSPEINPISPSIEIEAGYYSPYRAECGNPIKPLSMSENPAYGDEQLPNAASVQDLRPGAEVSKINLHSNSRPEGTRVTITSYPYDVELTKTVTSKFVDAEYKDGVKSFDGKPLKTQFSLADHSVLPSEFNGKYNRRNVAVLTKPAAEKGDALYTDKTKEALKKPYKELDGLGKILVNAHIKIQTGEFPKTK